MRFHEATMRAHGGEPFQAAASAAPVERVLYGRDDAWRFPTVDAMIDAMRANMRALRGEQR